MFCPNCGTSVEGSQKFCPSCGAPLQNGQQPNYQQNPYGGPAGGYRAPVPSRSIATCVLLSIVTCGIYMLYWLVCLANDLNTASGRMSDTSGGMLLLLSIVTCNIYLIYWMYKAGEKVNYIRQRNGDSPDSSTSILYLILSIFGLDIVSMCLIQSELNRVASNV